MLESHDMIYKKYHDVDLNSRKVMFKVITFSTA